MLLIVFAAACESVAAADPPAALRDPDSRFEISLFAAAPEIVNPIGVQVDGKGRVYVIESHTHFRPRSYEGPEKDRILVLEDTNGDGKADKTSVFHDGLTMAMDLLLAPSGELYVAERSAIHLLKDADADGKADDDKVIVRLETAGNYPHNGLSGLALDRADGLYFGLGENLGAAYKLVGSDGGALSGEAEGGSVYHCRRDGAQLRRVATGVWNPFGMCVDPAGNVFATDNDPDSSPPCRLLHIVDGGDYGYEFRYGRSGLHPFQCWNGELPGTLPMVCGTGEAPCEIVPWNNGLLVASWADNRLEHYALTPKGLSFSARQSIVASGDLSFRPVGIAVASDGSLFVSDWATASYELQDRGRIWKLKLKQPLTPGAPVPDLGALVKARRASIAIQNDRTERAAAALESRDRYTQAVVIDVISDFLRSSIKEVKASAIARPALVVAYRRAGRTDALPDFLEDPLPDVKIAALKWIADERLVDLRPQVEAGLKAPHLTRALFAAHLATLERLDRGKVAGDLPNPQALLPVISDTQRPASVRALALSLLPPDHRSLAVDRLRQLLAEGREELSLEAVYTMNLGRQGERLKLLSEVAADARQPTSVRAAAVSGLAGSGEFKGLLLELANSDHAALRQEALRSLVDLPLSEAEVRAFADSKDPAAMRLAGKKPNVSPQKSIDDWLRLADQPGDPDAGRRIFFHTKVGYCARCHRFEGRGGLVGPDLTRIGQRIDAREHILASLLSPANDVAPNYRQWQIITKNGQEFAGISLRKGSGSEDYLGADGKPFSVRLSDIEERRELPSSIMPDDLVPTMTPQELQDLLAFLMKR